MPEQEQTINAPTEPAGQSGTVSTPAAPAAATTEPTSTTTVKTGGKVYTEEQLEQILKERLEREKQAAKKATQEAAEKAASKAAEEAAKQNGEWQKLAEQREKELADAQAKLKARELADLKRAIAEKAGLPAALASRLVGDTEKELEDDAKALLETLPKTQQPPDEQKPTRRQPGMVPANPGAGGQQGETDEAKLQRIHGASFNPFDPNFARQRGGGVHHSGGADE